MKKKTGLLQIIRFLVQVLFMAGIFLSFMPKTRDVSSWLLPTILLAGVFFCGWVCPFGSAQEWMGKLGRLLHLPRLRMPAGAQRYLQLLRYAFYMLSTMGITFALLKGPRDFSLLMKGHILTVGSGVIIAFLLISPARSATISAPVALAMVCSACCVSSVSSAIQSSASSAVSAPAIAR